MRHMLDIDPYRIISNCYLNGDKLCINEKIEDEINRMLESRDYMYKHVYYHKRVKYFENIITNMMLYLFEHNYEIIECCKNPEIFIKLDDTYFFHLCYMYDDDPEMKNYIDKFNNRIK